MQPSRSINVAHPPGAATHGNYGIFWIDIMRVRTAFYGCDSGWAVLARKAGRGHFFDRLGSMQARAQSVGRGGDIFRGTWKKLNLGRKLRLGWGRKSARGTGSCAVEPRMEPTVALPASSLPATMTPLDAVPNELELARSEIDRQSRLLAAMAAETERFRAEATALTLIRCEALASISHDLRTPLNAVIGFSEAMQRELFGPLGHDRYKDYAVHIRESGEQLLKAAEAMIAQTRPDEPRL